MAVNTSQAKLNKHIKKNVPKWTIIFRKSIKTSTQKKKKNVHGIQTENAEVHSHNEGRGNNQELVLLLLLPLLIIKLSLVPAPLMPHKQEAIPPIFPLG